MPNTYFPSLKIINKTSHTIIADKAKIADTFFSRMVGLLNRKNFSEGEALIITKCCSIHMFFMHFPIDVLFVNKDNYIVGKVEGIKPFQLSPIFFSSSYAIELPAGTIIKREIAIGDNIEWQI